MSHPEGGQQIDLFACCEAYYLLGMHQLIDSPVAIPWLHSFVGIERRLQGFILYSWAYRTAQSIRAGAHSDSMIIIQRMPVYAKRMAVVQAAANADPAQDKTVEAVEWAARLFNAAGENDVDLCMALLGSIPDDQNEAGFWLGSLFPAWQEWITALVGFELDRNAAMTGPVTQAPERAQAQADAVVSGLLEHLMNNWQEGNDNDDS